MNLWLQINELLTNVFSFIPVFFFFLNCVVVLHILTLEIVSRGQKSNIRPPILIPCQITDCPKSLSYWSMIPIILVSNKMPQLLLQL